MGIIEVVGPGNQSAGRTRSRFRGITAEGFPPNKTDEHVCGYQARPKTAQSVRHAPAQADVLSAIFLKRTPELWLLPQEGLASIALGTGVMPHHPAEKAISSMVTVLQNRDELRRTDARSFPSMRWLRSMTIACCYSVSASSLPAERSAIRIAICG